MKISFFKGGIKKIKPYSAEDPGKIIDMIRSGAWKNEIKKLRQTGNADVRAVMKESLDYVTWSGIFKTRANDQLIEHSGLICLDFDNLTGVEAVKAAIAEIPFVYAVFISPRGNGLKVIVKINPSQHKASFDALADYFLKEKNITADSTYDVARACFVSFDGTAYYNPASGLFSLHATPETSTTIIPHIDTSNGESALDSRSIARCHGFATKQVGAYAEGNRNNYIFHFACNANRIGAEEAAVVDHCLSEFADVQEKELRATVNSAFKHHAIEHGKLADPSETTEKKKSNRVKWT